MEEIGYLLPAPEEVKATTTNLDVEITHQAGPQLVVPVSNARFAINAANARWGSLYDAYYGTDAIDQSEGKEPVGDYNPVRGAAVIAKGRELLDLAAPLTAGSHADSTGYRVVEGALKVTLSNGTETELANPEGFIGYTGSPEQPETVLLRHNGLHLEIDFDPLGTIGSTDGAGIQDIMLESAVTSIIDLEDSVAAVDAEDKTLCYSNWSGLVNGTLSEEVTKNGTAFTRVLADDRHYTAANGTDTISLKGRSLLLVRTVGHLMTTDAVLDAEGNEVPEGILDAIITSLVAVPNLRSGKEFFDRIAVYRQTEDARSGRSCFRRGDPGPGRAATRIARNQPEDRHYGRGASYLGQPSCRDQRSQRSGVLHQHRIPGSHR